MNGEIALNLLDTCHSLIRVRTRGGKHRVPVGKWFNKNKSSDQI